MKKYRSQIVLAFICLILGFMLTNKFKTLSQQNKNVVEEEQQKVQINTQIEQLKEQNVKLEKENDEIQEKVKNYEEQAADAGSIDQNVKSELDDARKVLGISEESEGKGITLSLTPKTKSFANKEEIDLIQDRELVYIVNELLSAGAEAIDINGKRITSQTGIRSSSGNSYILINDEKVSPKAKITIDAIGDDAKLQQAIDNLDKAVYSALNYYDLKIEVSDSIQVASYNKKYSSDYLKVK